MSDADKIKEQLNIVDYINERIKLKKAGRNFKALCPFHSEKTPSFYVSPERGMFKCFGCGKSGSVIDFVMEHDHVDFIEALEVLADKIGMKLTRLKPATDEERMREELFKINHLAREFFHYLLTQHKHGENARLYLKKRGVGKEAIETFMLGYSPLSWEALFRYLRKKGHDERFIEKAGLVIRGSGGYYDRFRGRVIFTLKDHRGSVVGFAGRVLDPKEKEAKYINTPETPIYSKSKVLYGLDITRKAISNAREAIIMEGEMGVISAFQQGISNVVAVKGSAITEDHAVLIRRFADSLIFSFDGDRAGDEATRRAIEVVEKKGLDMKVALLPKGKDPDDVIREDIGAYKRALHKALPVYDYYLISALSRHDKETVFGKKKISRELLPLFAKIQNPIIQGHYIRKLSKELDVAEDTVVEGLKKEKFAEEKAGARDKPEEKMEPEGSEVLTRGQKLERYILALMLQGKTQELFEEYKEHVEVSDIKHDAVRKIISFLEKFLINNRIFLIKDFADTLPKELTPTLDEAFLWDVSELIEDEELFAKEWFKALNDLRRSVLRQKITEISIMIRKAEESVEKDAQKKLQSLQKELKEHTAKLRDLEKQNQP